MSEIRKGVATPLDQPGVLPQAGGWPMISLVAEVDEQAEA